MRILAPVSGVTVPLERVPDPVFAQKMVGDGLGIDPVSNEVVAPFEGVVSQLHQASHAVAVRASNGLEVLIHVGIDTVSLKGQGFTALVKLGDAVVAGQPLIRFDADTVARLARSLITLVLATSLDGSQKVVPTAELTVQAGSSVLFEVTGVSAAPAVAAAQAVTSAAVRSAPVTLPNPNGLHARPAAVLAQQAKLFSSAIHLWRGTASANAKSVVSVMGLSSRQGDRIVVEASGPDAEQAIAALAKTLRDGSGEASSSGSSKPAVTPPAVSHASKARLPGDGIFQGVPASPGVAIGRIVQLKNAAPSVTEAGGSREDEEQKLASGLTRVANELQALAAKAGAGSEAGIINVQRELLEDPVLLEKTHGFMASGKSAAFAWKQAYLEQAAAFENLDQPLLQERAVDVRDVGVRLLRVLAGAAAADSTPLPDNAIVVTDELTPTQLATLDRSKFKGLVTTTGSATSHVAILARSMGVPAVMGVDDSALALTDGLEAVIDGTAGQLERAPDANDLAARAKLEERMTRLTAERQSERAAAFTVGQTRDGKRIEVVANISNLEDAREAMAGGAEGIGLLRSEFLFFDRDTAPGEAEQTSTYLAIAEAVGLQKSLVVRTLDVGGDKPLPYLPLPKEGNPFLGLRGIRVSLEQPAMFRVQLRAMLKAARATKLHIMFPMVSGLEELRAAKAMLAEEQHLLDAQSPLAVKVGVMIEVPSAVMMANAIAQEVDFFSIGTNDLTQYTLAMDRGHPQLAKCADALHPAVLKMISLTCEAARAHQKPVHVCGGIASDPAAAALLVGLGVTELSVSTPSVGAIKSALARWSWPECQALANEALNAGTTAEVRALLKTRQPGRLPTRAPIGPLAIAER